MRKPKLYKCSVCGVEIPELPMTALGHQMLHVKPRPYANDWPERDPPKDRPDQRPGDQG